MISPKHLCLIVSVTLSTSAFAADTAKSTVPTIKKEVVKTTKIKDPEINTPEVKPAQAPKVDAPKIESPKVELPKAETPTADALALGNQAEYGKSKGVFGDLPLTLGPKVSFGLPMPAAFGLEAKWDNLIGASFDYNYFPDLTISSSKLSANGIAGSIRVFPWRRALFIGLGIQKQSLSISRTEAVKVAGVTTNVTVAANDIGATYLVPHVGWRWTWNSGFWWGLELGWQQPLSSEGELTITPSNPVTELAIASTKKSVQDLKDLLGKQGIPKLALIQFGFLF